MFGMRNLLWALAAILLVAGAPGRGGAVEVGHHTVDYLGTVFHADGSATATWAVTENGCEPADPGTKGKGKGCNNMSHFALSDSFCDDADLLWPDGTGGALYWTVTDVPQCGDDTYDCVGTVYKPNLGKSPPDGPGYWLKFSNHTTEPETEQLAVGFTHVFSVTFWDGEAYVYDDESGAPVEYPNHLATAAIKTGKRAPDSNVSPRKPT